ncbi:MAG: 2-oxoacid:ferredoxin oxidoreductase subunit beta [Candidatus Melainabacteria bacterium]|jgi:2-oxoglutarate ferredoxin oxidoreductase subunit beta|uniref:2-oxoacid:ferredoxin oxidoreductase subunit beta n=1 Tax=Candidatus Obscuribacter phosphatis TaxID=1906157 RepID=A0A8J7PK34_9BACT|nr:2-oxoacid:ferredoxin oxidoreductase subunit beta [Candidatus Obscuribacter phosphatis]MCA0313310.1 2-oxoacid:ferredoxin oxidoreductase subunit beta [Candidatus Melainabacteria bacterium]
MATVIELPVELFKGPVDPDWCPGCGDFGVLKGVQMAAAKCGIKPENLLVVSGIGCSSNLPGFIHAYGIHSLHGRSVPVATGAHLANTDLKVVITGGDGDGYGIGVGHLLHAMRRNLDVTYVVMDNQIYGLTTGQTSPTTTLGHKTKSTPQGNIEMPLNPLALALTAGATYVARGFSGEQKHLAEIIAGAIEHKGFSLVDVFSPCVTYNKVNTYPWFKERVYKLEDEGWDPSDFHKSMEKAFEWGDKIPLGVLYKTDMPTYEDGELAFKKGPLVKQSLEADKKVFDSFIEELI